MDQSGTHMSKKKLRDFGHCPERGGSALQPNFLSMKGMDMCIEGGGMELLVQTSLLYKSLSCRSPEQQYLSFIMVFMVQNRETIGSPTKQPTKISKIFLIDPNFLRT